jgi:hypothetical protein
MGAGLDPMEPDSHGVAGGADDAATHTVDMELRGEVKGINKIVVTAADGTSSVATVPDFGFTSYIGTAVTSADPHSTATGFEKAFHHGETGDAEPFHAFVIRIANNNPDGFRLDIWAENGVDHTGKPSQEHGADTNYDRCAFLWMDSGTDVHTIADTQYNKYHFYRVLLEELNDHHAGVHSEVENGDHPHAGAVGEELKDATVANGTNISNADYAKARALAQANATDGEIHDFHIEINTGDTHTQALNNFGYNVRIVLEKNFMLNSGVYEETFHFQTTDL